jgi:hypothetical protein
MPTYHGNLVDGTLMKSTKMRFKKEIIPSDCLIGISFPCDRGSNGDREPPRPAVAPFSSMDQAEDSFVPLHIAYPSEGTSSEEDEVMMDFVSGK